MTTFLIKAMENVHYVDNIFTKKKIDFQMKIQGV